jgi:hypothetical protein
MDFYMDWSEGMKEGQPGNDADRIEHGCHSVVRRVSGSGGSEFAFVDGSVRYLRYGMSVWPLNLWPVYDEDRTALAFQAP